MSIRNVLITGIYTGLGLALAKACLDRGDRVFGLNRHPPDGLADHQRLLFRVQDLTRFEEIPGALAELLAGVKQVDLVVLNAGVLGDIKDLSDTPVDDLRRVMDVNVWANKSLVDALMKGPWRVPQIVAMSSGAAFNGSGGWGAYSISKSALNLLVRVFAHEHPETHFTALAPGVVMTPMLERVLAAPEDPRHSANTRIREARREGRVLDPDAAAVQILGRVKELLERPSGGFVDIRQM